MEGNEVDAVWKLYLTTYHEISRVTEYWFEMFHAWLKNLHWDQFAKFSIFEYGTLNFSQS